MLWKKRMCQSHLVSEPQLDASNANSADPD